MPGRGHVEVPFRDDHELVRRGLQKACTGGWSDAGMHSSQNCAPKYVCETCGAMASVGADRGATSGRGGLPQAASNAAPTSNAARIDGSVMDGLQANAMQTNVLRLAHAVLKRDKEFLKHAKARDGGGLRMIYFEQGTATAARSLNSPWEPVMQPRPFFAVVAALAVSTAFASRSSGAGSGKVKTAKGTPTTPQASTIKASPGSGAVRVDPQPLPPLANRVGGDPPTVIDRR